VTMDVSDFASVVLTYGDEPRHSELVHELCDQGVQPEKITVVHNPVTIGAPDRLVVDGIEIVRNARNMGYPSAINVGLRQPRVRATPAVFVVTDDVRLDSGVISASATALEANPTVGIFGMTMQRISGEVFSFGGLELRGGFVKHLRELPKYSNHHLVDCDWVDGAAWVFRTDLLDDVGLLEERYFMYYEEPLICLKARRAGWGVATIVDARVRQSPGSDKRPAAQAYLLARNSLHYAAAAGGWSNAAYGAIRLLNMARWERTQSRDHDLDPTERARHRLRSIGIVRGIKAAICAQWGPPPEDLPGPSDIVATNHQ
jgi:N-acetylglucosaminyl-diphospho-decaprenol L-rhamnosyltransferase